MDRDPIDPQLRRQVGRLDADGLRALNRWVVERLHRIQEAQTQAAARGFRLGDQVQFAPPCGHPVRGRVVRINRKTITIENGEGSWRVPPTLLAPVEAPAPDPSPRPA